MLVFRLNFLHFFQEIGSFFYCYRKIARVLSLLQKKRLSSPSEKNIFPPNASLMPLKKSTRKFHTHF